MKLETDLINQQRGNPFGSVVPPIHVSSTFEIADSNHFELSESDKNEYSYLRFGSPTLSKLELTLAALEDNCLALTYPSGLAAISAVIEAVQPRRIIISGGGYHGTHSLISLHEKGRIIVNFVDSI